MPLYEFVCRACDKQQELLVRGDDQPACEACGSDRLMRLLSVPTAHVAGSTSANNGPPAGGSCGGGCACHPH